MTQRETRTCELRVRMTPAERQACDVAAERAGDLDASKWLRRLIRRELGRLDGSNAKHATQLEIPGAGRE